eukprot:m.149874 g.149874  ORF g.149874 m.149874 type:complete len:519 (-) comp13274_c1_seq3:930-2486(-)
MDFNEIDIARTMGAMDFSSWASMDTLKRAKLSKMEEVINVLDTIAANTQRAQTKAAHNLDKFFKGLYAKNSDLCANLQKKTYDEMLVNSSQSHTFGRATVKKSKGKTAHALANTSQPSTKGGKRRAADKNITRPSSTSSTSNTSKKKAKLMSTSSSDSIVSTNTKPIQRKLKADESPYWEKIHAYFQVPTEKDVMGLIALKDQICSKKRVTKSARVEDGDNAAVPLLSRMQPPPLSFRLLSALISSEDNDIEHQSNGEAAPQLTNIHEGGISWGDSGQRCNVASNSEAVANELYDHLSSLGVLMTEEEENTALHNYAHLFGGDDLNSDANSPCKDKESTRPCMPKSDRGMRTSPQPMSSCSSSPHFEPAHKTTTTLKEEDQEVCSQTKQPATARKSFMVQSLNSKQVVGNDEVTQELIKAQQELADTDELLLLTVNRLILEASLPKLQQERETINNEDVLEKTGKELEELLQLCHQHTSTALPKELHGRIQDTLSKQQFLLMALSTHNNSCSKTSDNT